MFSARLRMPLKRSSAPGSSFTLPEFCFLSWCHPCPARTRRKASSTYMPRSWRKQRVEFEAIDQMLLQRQTVLADQLTREFCALQLRMLCELIALGCLVAHGDIPATRTSKLVGTPYADRIMAALDRLHPEFYPRPVRQTGHGVEDVTTGSLSKDELVKLVGICGNALHRGSAKKLLRPQTLPRDDIIEWAQKIRTLLDIHWFTLSDGRPHYLCSMTGGEGGKVGVSYIPTSTTV